MGCLRHSLNEVTATPAISADCFQELPAARASNAIITGAGMPSLSKTSSRVGRRIWTGFSVMRKSPRSDDDSLQSAQGSKAHDPCEPKRTSVATQPCAAWPVLSFREMTAPGQPSVGLVASVQAPRIVELAVRAQQLSERLRRQAATVLSSNGQTNQ